MKKPHVTDSFSASNLTSPSVRWILHITERQQQIAELINLVGLCGLVSIFGTVANIINITVFYSQGLNTTINVSFFSLAVSDLACVLLQQWHILITLCQFTELPIVYTDFQYATALWPHETFTRVTCSITVFITLERCLCITFPLTIKKLITLGRTSAIIISIYTVTLLSWVPLYKSSYIEWRLFPERNQTLLGLIFIDHEHIFTAINFTNAFFGVLSVSVVVLLTVILIWQLKAKSKWRTSANVQQKNSDSLSNRDRTTVLMVVLIAIILIVCYTPSVILCVVTFCNPQFSIGGKYFSIYQVLWSTANVLENINSSVNIFLYFKMSSKYRSTFNILSEQWCISKCNHPKGNIS